MGLTARQTTATPPPSGTHPATCVQVIDLGHQTEEWDGAARIAHKVLIGWELDCPEKRDDGSPFIVWRRFTLSLSPKSALRPMLESWRGRKFTDDELASFDISKLVGATCMVTVTHAHRDGVSYANVSSVVALPRGSKAPVRTSATIVFDLDHPDMSVFGTFSPRLQDTIRASREWAERSSRSDEPAIAPHDDDIPF